MLGSKVGNVFEYLVLVGVVVNINYLEFKWKEEKFFEYILCVGLSGKCRVLNIMTFLIKVGFINKVVFY